MTAMNLMAVHVRTFNLALVPADVDDMSALIEQLREILPEDGQLWTSEQWYAPEKEFKKVGANRRVL